MEQQYVAIEIEKTKTVSSVLERHILRQDVRYDNGKKIIMPWTPDNADPNKVMLNRELVSRDYFDPETGERKTRTINQAIFHRIEAAGIKRMRHNQNVALEIILTGSPETMNSLDDARLAQWVKESMEWAGSTWGKDNIVTAVLHRDEKTPHIHLVVVPIVRGLSRRSKARDEMLRRVGKEVKTKKRNTTGNRLCANEVFTQPRLYAYHTSYAKEVGSHFGLVRGVRGEKGSRKKHQKSIDYNRKLERKRLELEGMIAEMKKDYSQGQTALQEINVNMALAQTEVHLAEERRTLAKREEAEAKKRSEEAKLQAKALEEILKSLKEKNEAVKQLLDYSLEKGSEIEKQIAEREDYLQSLGTRSLLEFVAEVPELIMKELDTIVNKYVKCDVESFLEKSVLIKKKEMTVNEKFLEMRIRDKQNGNILTISVCESDGVLWCAGKPFLTKNGKQIIMKDVVEYFTRSLTAEGKALVLSLFKKQEPTPIVDDSVMAQLRQKYGGVAVNLISPIMNDGKETGTLYHIIVGTKQVTAVFDYDAKEICICGGHVKKEAFYLDNWKTLSGKPALAVNGRVFSVDYHREHKGHGIG